ncbi:hypothetical protein ANO14919_113960 [Xylariales sp. No.14919]|nr:hypothetical protein ANO14919_113960 [Xylariales sp. No.14919]
MQEECGGRVRRGGFKAVYNYERTNSSCVGDGPVILVRANYGAYKRRVKRFVCSRAYGERGE